MTIEFRTDSLTASTHAQQPSFCVQTCVAYDADEQARNLHGWSQTYDQLTAGRFVGGLTELCLDHMQVFVETTSHTLRQTCEVQEDAYWFGIPTCPAGSGRIDTQVISSDALAFRPGGIEFELLTSAGYEIFGVVVKSEVLRRYAAEVERVGLADHLPNTEVVPIGTARKERLCASLRQLLDDGAANGAPLSTFARNNLQASVLASLFDVGALPANGQIEMPTRGRRQSIVSEAREYVLANRERAINVPELCERLHVSRRTLQYCFQDVLGMAPATYLRTIRLNGARRDLCNASRDSRSVQDIAAAWGFWHLSQFATDYRKLFGMRPSDTLKAAFGAHQATGRRSFSH
ncbi:MULTISPECIES: helix-turn-helix domain-containing protein [Paraburkholderia]|uniref:helix-turn-helix domain-containing protein n=1 Tax=Paraburkholderia TaxID=1822464 RepID=UPI002258FD1A|nr:MULTISPECIES: helix-turn-helix domain-containing protein [Paraburkholderia]MCX4140513.1 helix-turn-helix domain-containing protein [Paraburkholderia aspalathi]MDN7173198.1 helix-turn-helix domain-containing protein [Paraburkholderia sp. SEWSISQ10-3 4]MDQ6502839.1 helix-turn-helix domain-containing protein [Paraburkholderia aspalathi]